MFCKFTNKKDTSYLRKTKFLIKSLFLFSPKTKNHHFLVKKNSTFVPKLTSLQFNLEFRQLL